MSEIPEWFWAAVDEKPESHYIDVDDCDIKVQRWGDRSKPALQLVHGHNAHAHWWDFIAPRLTDEYQIVAHDMSGMGDSDHRDAYTTDRFADEIIAVAEDCGLDESRIVAAHSFGGYMALRAACRQPAKALVLLDSGVKRPGNERDQGVERWTRPKVYPTFDVAKSRFRLQPPQTCENQYLVEYIARNSIDKVDEGWVWKFDEELDSRMTHTGDMAEDFRSLDCPLALIYGQNSELYTADDAAYMKELRDDLRVVELADAQHHLFLDQPLAFVESLKAVLAEWA